MGPLFRHVDMNYPLGSEEELTNLIAILQANNRNLNRNCLGLVLDGQSMDTLIELLETNAMLIGMLKQALRDHFANQN